MSKIKVSVAIMSVPNAGRDENVTATLGALPDAWQSSVVYDPNREGVWPTARKAWAERPTKSTHHLVLSDDAILCDHFEALLMAAIKAKPTAVMSLCARNRMAVEEAVIARRSWLHASDMVYGQAILVPSSDVDGMLAWVKDHVKPSYEHDDGRVGMWARATGRGVYTPVPQLVRHMEGPSLMGHPPARGLGTPLFAADRETVNWDTEALSVSGSTFGGGGLLPDVPPNVKILFGVSLAPPSRQAQTMDAMRQAYKATRKINED